MLTQGLLDHKEKIAVEEKQLDGNATAYQQSMGRNQYDGQNSTPFLAPDAAELEQQQMNNMQSKHLTPVGVSL